MPEWRLTVDIEDEDLNYQLERVAEICIAVGDCLLVVEETTRYIESAHDVEQFIRRLMKEGRRQRVDVFFLSQRPSELPPSLRACITDLHAFSSPDPGDRDWILKCIGRQHAPGLLEIQKHEHYHWNLWTSKAVLIPRGGISVDQNGALGGGPLRRVDLHRPAHPVHQRQLPEVDDSSIFEKSDQEPSDEQQSGGDE